MQMKKIIAGVVASALALTSIAVSSVTASATEFGSEDGETWSQDDFVNNSSPEMADVDLAGVNKVVFYATANDLNWGWNYGEFYGQSKTTSWTTVSYGGTEKTADITLENTGAFSAELSIDITGESGDYWSVGWATSCGVGAFELNTIKFYKDNDFICAWTDGVVETVDIPTENTPFGSSTKDEWEQDDFLTNSSSEMSNIDLSGVDKVVFNAFALDLNWGWNYGEFYGQSKTTSWTTVSYGGTEKTADITLENTGAFSAELSIDITGESGDYWSVGWATSCLEGCFELKSIEFFKGNTLVCTWIAGTVIVEEEPEVTTEAEETQPEETEPDDTQPDETEPDDTQPDETEPDDTQPDETEPDDTQPDETEPDDTQPDETEPDDTQPDETEPDDTQPDETEPDDTQPDETEPDDTQPDETEPDDTQPDETEPDDTQPDETEPDDTQPDETEPDDTQPDETEPDDTQPDETEPDDTQPDETEPDDTQPDETEPDNTQPEESEPEVTEPEETVKFEASEDSVVKGSASAAKGVVPDGSTLKIVDDKANSKDNQVAYDICFVDKNGNTVTVNGEVTVVLPVPETLKADEKDLKVFYTPDGKKFEDMRAVVADGYITFKTTHFSTYVITKTDPASAAGNTDDKNDDKTNQPTGLVIAVLPTAAAASAVIVFKKRK